MLALALSIPGFAQNPKAPPVTGIPQKGMVSGRTIDSIARIAFAKMATGSEELASLSNNVTLVPTDGKFSLSGNYFFPKSRGNDPEHKKQRQHFAIGFNAAGSVAGDNVSELFSGGKLNTGTDIGIKIHWRTNHPKVGYTMTGVLLEKQRALNAERDAKIAKALNAITLLPEKIQRDELKIKEKRIEITLQETKVNTTLQHLDDAKTDALKLKCAEELATLREQISKNKDTVSMLTNSLRSDREIHFVSTIDIKDTTERADSVTLLLDLYGLRSSGSTASSYAQLTERAIREEYTQKQLTLEMALPVEGLHISWLSGSVSWNRAAYRTYYVSLPFDQALSKVPFDGLTAGLQWNHYSLLKPVRRAGLFTIGLTFKNTNDLADFSTSKFTQTSTVIGTAERKVTDEYNVYTDPITPYKTWQVPISYYRFFGENMNLGWHVFALADFRNTKKEIYDLGAGFVLGLNSTGTKKLLNIELTTTYKDLKRELITDKDTSQWKQLVIGLSLTVPFLLFKN